METIGKRGSAFHSCGWCGVNKLAFFHAKDYDMLESIIGFVLGSIVVSFIIIIIFVDHEREKIARAQIYQNIIASGGSEVSVISIPRRRLRYVVEYQDGKGNLYTAECWVKFRKRKLHVSWSRVSKSSLHGRVTADYDQLHEAVKLLCV